MDNLKVKVLLHLADGNIDEAVNVYSRYSLITGNHDSNLIKEILKSAMIFGNSDVKKAMTKLVRKLKFKELIPALRFLLNDSNTMIRALTVLSLASLRDLESLDSIRRLASHSESKIRSAAVLALGSFEDPKSYPIVKKAIFDNSEDVRGSAASSLGWYQRPDGFAILIQRLKGPIKETSPKVKSKILRALFWDKSMDTLKTIEDILYSERDPSVWLTAAEVLYRKEQYGVKLLLEATLINLKETLRSPKRREQEYALESLAHTVWEYYKIPQNMRIDIINIIEDNILTGDQGYVRKAIKALRNLLPESASLLLDIATTTYLSLSRSELATIRAEAIDVLSTIASKDKMIQIHLIEFLKDTDPRVQESALFALIDLNLSYKYIMKSLSEILVMSEDLKNRLIALGLISKLLTSEVVS